MDSTIHRNGSWQIHTMSGRLTQADRTEMMDVMKAMSTDDSLVGIRLEMAGLSFVDSFGVGLLLLIRDEAIRLGKKLVLSGAQGPVFKLLKLSGLDSLLDNANAQAKAALDANSSIGVLTVLGPSAYQDGVRFDLQGRFTFATHPPFFDITEYMTAHKGTVYVNLEQLDYMDSSAISMMVMANDTAKQSHARLVFQKPVGRVARLFDLTNLWQTLTIEP